jgi:hypothetical protein
MDETHVTQPQVGEVWLVHTPTMLPDRAETFRAEVVCPAPDFMIRPEGKKTWPIIFGRAWFVRRVQ